MTPARQPFEIYLNDWNVATALRYVHLVAARLAAHGVDLTMRNVAIVQHETSEHRSIANALVHLDAKVTAGSIKHFDISCFLDWCFVIEHSALTGANALTRTLTTTWAHPTLNLDDLYACAIDAHGDPVTDTDRRDAAMAAMHAGAWPLAREIVLR